MLKAASGLAIMSIAAQALALAALPLIAAFFSPQDFNNLAAFTSASLILITIASLRLEMAIPIVSSDRDAVTLTIVSGVTCVILALAVLIVLQTLRQLEYLAQELEQILVLLPLSVLAGGAQAILLSRALRQKKLQATGLVRIAQTLTGVVVQILAGLWAYTQFGLVIGFLANLFVGATLLYMVTFSPSSIRKRKNYELAEFGRVVQQHRNYIRYSSLDALLNVSSLQLPIFLISMYAEGAIGGLLFLALKLFYTPATIISGAFAKIYHSAIGAAVRDGDQTQLTEETLLHLMRYGGGFVIIAVLFGPTAVSLLMANEWSQIGTMLLWMAPWIVLQLICSPISTIMLASGKQKALYHLALTGFFLRVGSVAISLILMPEMSIPALVVSSMAFYSLAGGLFFSEARITLASLGVLIKRSLPIWGIAFAVTVLASEFTDAFT
jgi:O-antigen/teichoic acid export membrane protein